MNFLLERVTQPEIEPVTLAEMKRHLRCFDSVTDQDDDITKLIVAAREWVEDYTGRALIDQTWRMSIGDYLPNVVTRSGWSGTLPLLYDELLLRRSPIIALTSFLSVDSDGVETAVDVEDYTLRDAASKWPRMVGLSGTSWTTGVLKIEYRAGYADRLGSPVQGAEMVPERFKQAMKLWAEANFDRDKDMMTKLIQVAEQLVKPERVDLQFA